MTIDDWMQLALPLLALVAGLDYAHRQIGKVDRWVRRFGHWLKA